MEDQFIQSVKVLKERRMSQREMAAELKVPRSQVLWYETVPLPGTYQGWDTYPAGSHCFQRETHG